MFRNSLSAFLGLGLAVTAATHFAAPAQAVLHITEAPGYSINWDGNDGAFFSASNPALAPANLALASNGTTPFASSEFGANHLTVKLNDGSYGNTDSWIGNPGGGPTPSAGVAFAGVQHVTSIAWGRDNGNNAGDCCGGQLTDRSFGVYTLQRTTVAAPGAGTADTGDASTGWETVGTLNYYGNSDTAVGGGFSSFLRHEYQIAHNGAPVAATAFRLLAPNGNAIDEIEAYSGSVNLGLDLVSVGAPGVPNSIAAASNGSVAFAKDLIANGGFAPTHTIDNLNDGLYGNSDSWIGNSDPTFAGIRFGTPQVIGGIAFGRDTGGEAQVFTDRDGGVYLIQYTLDPNAGLGTLETDWITIGSATIDPNDPLGHLRHEYSFDAVFATGIRIVTQTSGIAIDEIEVFEGTIVVPEPATMSLLGLGALMMLRRRRVNA